VAEPLKNHYGPEVPGRVASMIGRAYPGFDVYGFVADCLDGYEQLELTARAQHTTRTISRESIG
jgi:hypothetical protein